MSIQNAIDAASTYSTIVVCSGIYAEALDVAKDGLTLRGKGDPVLDGALLTGKRYAVTIADGVQDFALTGFEIRSYARTIETTNDTSSAIVSLGNTSNVMITENKIHDNAWSGIVFANGKNEDWKIVNNTFTGHGFAHIFSHHAEAPEIRSNVLGAADHAIILAASSGATISQNVIQGGGRAGIILSPALDGTLAPTGAHVDNNTLNGTWTHGIWALKLDASTIRDNNLTTQHAALTLGGNLELLTVHNNTGGAVAETNETQEAEAGFEAMTYSATLPSVSTSKLDTFFEWVLLTALNPLATSENTNDLSRLRSCTGQSDNCLRTAFFDANDTRPSQGWTTVIADHPLLGSIELRFLDVGIRRQNESRAWRFIGSEMDHEWTTLVLCRMYIQGQATHCAAAPRIFDYGLDIQWSQSEYAQHASLWRLKLPSDLTHASFDRIHAKDATLFKHESKPHDATLPSSVTTLAEAAPDPLRTVYAGRAVLRCILATSPDELPNPEDASQCGDPALLEQPFSPAFYWCSGDLIALTNGLHHDESVHSTRDIEQATGLWDWSSTCQPTSNSTTTNWSALYDPQDLRDLGSAHGDYHNATTPELQADARKQAEHVLLRGVGRHLALRVENLSLPLIVGAPTDDPSAFNATMLEWESGARANLDLINISVQDAQLGWIDATVPEIASLTPLRLGLQVSYRHLNGDLLQSPFEVIFSGEDPVMRPVLVEYADTLLGSVVAWDPDDLDYIAGFKPGSARAQTYTLVNVTAEDAPVGMGLIDAAFQFPVDVGSFRVCTQALWTANSSGTSVNLDDVTRLAIDEEGCVDFDTINRILLQYFSRRHVTLELRETDAYRTTFQLIHEPLKHLVNIEDPGKLPNLTEVMEKGDLPAWNRSIADGAVRLIVETPPMPDVNKSILLAMLLNEFGPHVGLVAVEMEDVPLTAMLDEALRNAVDEHGLLVIAGVGILPPHVRGWEPQDKLMTIHGLASHPSVITIGIGGIEGGVAASSRLGPNPAWAPKPDFVAPSLLNTSRGAVLNALPIIEAVLLTGFTDVDLARAVLASFAVPIKNERGAAATHWEQGFGSLDPSAYLQLPSTDQLLQDVANFTNTTKDQVATTAASTLNVSKEEILAAPPSAIAGAVAPATALIRAALGQFLLNLSVDSPAFPMTLQADFGVVNNEHVGAAYVGATDLDSVVNATARGVKVILREAGYTGTDLDNITNALLDLINVSAVEGQDVTLNVTHYHVDDTFTSDTLYAMYHRLLEIAHDDRGDFLPDVTQQDLLVAQAPLEEWVQLKRYYLADEIDARVSVRASLDMTCDATTAMEALDRLSEAVTTILNLEGGSIAGRKPSSANWEPNENPFVSLQTQSYLYGQGTQLLCLQDALTLLEQLRLMAQDTKALKAAAWGALNETEAWTGAYDQTLLGGQLSETFAALGLDPSDVASSQSTLVIDTVLEAIDRTIALMEQKIRFLGLPRLQADSPQGAEFLYTNVSQTSQSPLGFYVGMATLTSHDVTSANPMLSSIINLGGVTRSRDITIPIPSFLWNNPTQHIDIAYRDTTPIADTTVLLHSQEAQIFDQVTIDVIRQSAAGINVPLTPDPDSPIEDELEHLLQLIENIDTLLEEVDATPDLYLFGTPLRQYLVDLKAHLEARVDELLAMLDQSDFTGKIAPDRAVSMAITSLTGRLAHQRALTNESGVATMLNLFPGRYRLFEPYPYPVRADLTQDYAPSSPGDFALQGPMGDLDYDVSRLVRDFNNRLLGQDDTVGAGTTVPKAVPPTCQPSPDTCSFVPFFEVGGQWLGPFHQFGLEIQGPDLPSIGCAYLKNFSIETRTDLSWAACALPSTSPALLQALTPLIETARCILDGSSSTSLDEAAATACAEYHESVAEAVLACQSDWTACQDAEYLERVREAAENVLKLARLLPAGSPLAYPYFHSPLRLMLQEPARVGFTPDALLASTRALNPGSYDADNLTAAIEEVLATLPTDRGVFGTQEPPRESTKKHTQTQGIAHHLTDKVTGHDWFHLGPSLPTTPTTEDTGRLLIQDARDMIVNESDHAVARDFLEHFDPLPDSDKRAAVEAGIVKGLDGRMDYFSAGWRPNGTTTPDGLALEAPLETSSSTAESVCAAASLESGLPSTYFRCESLTRTFREADLDGEGIVDKVQFANALLDAIASSPDYAGNSTRIKEIMTRAVALSTIQPGESWSRTNDAIRLESDKTPLIGLMAYNLQVPVNEYVQVRLDAEILANNTGVVVISTLNPLIVRSLGLALNTLDASELTDPSDFLDADGASFAHLGSADVATFRLVDALNELVGYDPFLRVEALGLPVAADATAWWRPEQLHNNDCLACARSLLTARPDSFHNYSRTHEFNTRGLGSGGAETLSLIVLYYPTTPTSDGVSQKLLLRNFSIQLTTYLGLANGEDSGTTGDATTQGGRDTNTFDWTFPIRYEPKVEDWKMLYAVPDQALATGDDPGLRVNFTIGGNTWTPTWDDFLSPIANTSYKGDCPDTVAPGYPVEEFWQEPRLPHTNHGHLLVGEDNPCKTDKIVALRPYHTRKESPGMWWTTTPVKEIADLLNYHYQLDFPRRDRILGNLLTEDMTIDRQRPPEIRTGTVCNKLCASPFSYPHAPLQVVPAESIEVLGLGGDLYEQVLGPRGDLAGLEPVLDLSSARPFTAKSFLPGAQWTRSSPALASLPVHNWVVMDETRARDLLQTTTGHLPPYTMVRARDHTDPALAAEEAIPVHDAVEAQTLPLRDDESYRALVTAAEFRVSMDDPNEGAGNVMTKTAAAFAGHGVSGTGLALSVRTTGEVMSADDNWSSFLDGHRIEGDVDMDILIHRLGGNRTIGSDCSSIPLYHHYAEAYFRCTGHSMLVELEYSANETTRSNCYGAALHFLKSSEEEFIQRLTQDADPYHVTRPIHATLLATLGGAAPPAGGGVSRVHEIAAMLDEVRTQEIDTQNKVRDLLDCVETELEAGGRAKLLPDSTPAQFTASLRVATEAAQSGNKTQMSEALMDFIRWISVDLWLYGEPPRLVTAQLDPTSVLAPYLSRAGVTALGYHVDEWSSRVAWGELNLTVTPPEGAATSSQLAWARVPDAISGRAPLPSALSGASAVWNGSRVIIMGGEGPGGYSSQIIAYDPEEDTYELLPITLPTPRAYGSAVAFGGVVYLFGGREASGAHLREFLRIDPVNLHVETAPGQFIAGLTHTAATTSDSEIYIVGGLRADSAATTPVLRYDPTTGQLTYSGSKNVNGVSTVWNGTHLFIFGGGQAGDSNEILRYERASGNFVTMAAKLPSPRSNTSAVWDGTHAYILGGSSQGTASREILRYDPATDRVELMNGTLPVGGRGATSVWTGTEARTFGGHSGSPTDAASAYDPTIDTLREQAIKIGPAPSSVNVTLQHGHAYILNLTVEDEHGNRFHDEKRFLSDIQLPRILTNLTPNTSHLKADWTTADLLDLAWSVEDADSGLSKVELQRLTGTWQTLQSHTGLDGAGEMNVTQTLDLTSLGDNSSVRLRVIATDRAGNTLAHEYWIRVDRTLPILNGTLPDIVQDQNLGSVILVPQLNTSARVWDNQSGIEHLRIWIYNHSSGEETTIHQQHFGDPLVRDSTLLNHSHPAWPNITYSLNASVTDHAGNTWADVLAQEDVQIYPYAVSIVPEFLNQAMDTHLRIHAYVDVPNYTALPVDRLRLTVTQNSTNTSVFDETILDTWGEVGAFWNASAAAPGAYRLRYEIGKGLATSRLDLHLDVTSPYNSAMNLTRYRTYGTLNGTADEDVYRVKHPGGCSDTFTIGLQGDDGHDVDLYFGAGEPSTNPTLTVQETSTSSTESTQVTGATAGQVYTLAIKHKVPTETPDSAYSITYEKSCGGSDPDRTPPVLQLDNVT